VNIGVRTGSLANAQVPLTPLILSLIGIGILSVSGYLGGMMVYDDGIAVGRHRRRTATPQHTLHRSAAHLKAEPGSDLVFVEVARDADLHNGETLRVEIDGQTMVLAKWDGGVYAFQEFCTHRFGPLSEGVIKNGQVECPWHRSCFELRTGKVTHGPAKVELKTFRTEIRNGNICVGMPGPQEQKLAA
jgi:3-phenylpropionate/trans-cinnamate dioxygenase ferredoxin subunit/anthranilate 1,2-dioxygenase ferredoxin subunit